MLFIEGRQVEVGMKHKRYYSLKGFITFYKFFVSAEYCFPASVVAALVLNYYTSMMMEDIDRESDKALGSLKDEKGNKTESMEDAKKENSQPRFRSVAATNHPDTGDKKLENDLTMVVDMSQKDLSECEADSYECQGKIDERANTSAVGKSNLQEKEREFHQSPESAKKKLFPKSVPVFVFFSMIVGIVMLLASLIRFILLVGVGVFAIYLPTATLVRLYTTLYIEDGVLMAGIMVILISFGITALSLAFHLFHSNCKRIFRWIRTGIRMRRAKKLEALANET